MLLNICKLHPNAKIPTYATDGAACMDLYAATVDDYTAIGSIVTRQRPVLIGTGWAFAVPPGWMLKIHPRSGLKLNHRIEAFSGVIDSDYTGEVMVLMESTLDEDDGHGQIPPAIIRPGDRVAQASLVPSPKVTFNVVEQLSLTERGDAGFGSTGL